MAYQEKPKRWSDDMKSYRNAGAPVETSRHNDFSSRLNSSSGIAPLDIPTIKHIYEKALLISKLEEEVHASELDMIMDKAGEAEVDYEANTATAVAEKYEKFENTYGIDSVLSNGKLSDQDVLSDRQQQDIWSPTGGDMQALHHYYKRIREENGRLRVLLNVREEEVNLLREKYKCQESELKKALADVKEGQKAKDQLKVLNDQLKAKSSKLEAELKTVNEDMKYCQDGRNRLGKEVLRLEKDFNLEREARSKLENSLHQVLQEKQKDMLLQEENWKALHKDEVERLNRTITELGQKLGKEEEVRRCVQQGLESLDRHFTRTSPPLSESHLSQSVLDRHFARTTSPLSDSHLSQSSLDRHLTRSPSPLSESHLSQSSLECHFARTSSPLSESHFSSSSLDRHFTRTASPMNESRLVQSPPLKKFDYM